MVFFSLFYSYDILTAWQTNAFGLVGHPLGDRKLHAQHEFPKIPMNNVHKWPEKKPYLSFALKATVCL